MEISKNTLDSLMYDKMKQNLPIISDQIETIINTKITQSEKIEDILEILLNYVYVNLGDIEFGRLNSYYHNINPINSNEYNHAYHELKVINNDFK